MADKILPQRVSAFQSSPQPAPTLCCSAPLLPQEQSFGLSFIATFTFCFKSSLRSEAPHVRGQGRTEERSWRAMGEEGQNTGPEVKGLNASSLKA